MSFEPLIPMWTAYTLWALVLVFLLMTEWRKSSRWLALRLTGVVAVTISLALLLLQPRFSQEKKSEGVILLTAHYVEKQLDSLLQQHPDCQVLAMSSAEARQNIPRIESRKDLAALRDVRFVLGDGLTPSEQEVLRHKRFTSLFSPGPPGVTALVIPYSTVGKETAITGILRGSGVTVAQLQQHKILASVTIPSGSGPFTLRFTPTVAGRQTYRLLTIAEGDTIENTIPINVRESPVLNVLILQSAPQFEIRELKNFLAENRHRVAVRSQISKDNHRLEFINQPPAPLPLLTDDSLDKLDLLVIDSETLEAESERTLTAIEDGVRRGLGILLLINSEAQRLKYSTKLSGLHFVKNLRDTVHLQVAGEKVISPVATGLPVAGSEWVPVPNLNGWAGYIPVGLGSIGIQLLQQTYQLRLQGRDSTYAQVWGPLIEVTVRNGTESTAMAVTNSFPIYPGEKISIKAVTGTDKFSLVGDNQVLPVREDVVVDGVYHATLWAGSPGWHETVSHDSIRLHYFVSDTSECKTLRLANSQRLQRASLAPATKSTEVVKDAVPLSPRVVLVLFLIGTGLLWLAPKLG